MNFVLRFPSQHFTSIFQELSSNRYQFFLPFVFQTSITSFNISELVKAIAMSTLKFESELAKIDGIHDLHKLKDKWAARDRVMKTHEKIVMDWIEQPIKNLNEMEIEKKIGEVTFSSELYRALQTKFKELSAQDEHFNLEQEQERAEPILAKGEASLTTLHKLFKVKQLHLKGQELLFNLSVLQDLDQLNTITGRAETVEFKSKVMEFHRKTITYSEVSSLSDNRSDLMMGVKKLMQRLNEEQLSHERFTSASSSSFTSDSPSDYKVNKLKIKLPRFDGNPIHWNSFWENFDIKAERGMVEPHKKNALIEAMQCPKAREVAETASKGSYSYMLDRLKSKYAMPRILFPLHWKALTIRSTVNWKKEDIDHLANDLDYHVRGLQEIDAASFEHIVAHLVIQSFSKECREQWDRFEGVSANPPVLSQVVDFIQQSSLRLSGREDDDQSSYTFSGTNCKPTYCWT